MSLIQLSRFTAGFVAAFIFSLPVEAQETTLTSFTFSPDNREIGRIVARPLHSLPGDLKLSGESARLFTIDKNQRLAFRKKKQAKSQTPWYQVVVQYTRQGITGQDTFRVVKDEFIRNKVIAHRGAWKNTGATENSIAALQHAIRLGCAGSEFDAHMSADSVIYIFHDAKFQQTGIEAATAAELSALKLSNGESLPTLAAHLEEGLKQNKTRLILELKPSVVSGARGQALARKAVALVRRYQAQGWVDYISFDYDILKQVLALDPYARVAYLKGDKSPAEVGRDKFYGLDYHFSVFKKNPDWLQAAKQQGLTINVWTVNDPVQMDWLLDEEVDFITTNEPELLLKKVKKRAR